ncbi:MAG: DnaJ domain-containing protein, partial [Candidatus Kapabacteria bacterium]|nr:DnaJ domain-containing protein [Candidatus Kapabacteria bacterium]
SRTVQDILDAGDDELRRIIDELNTPRPANGSATDGDQQSESTSGRQKQREYQRTPPPHDRSAPRYDRTVQNAYTALGLKPSATIDDIKSAYRKLMLTYHPDRVAHQTPAQQEQAKRKAQEINIAYEILQKVRKF